MSNLAESKPEARQQVLLLIENKFGSLKDLPAEVISVVWVTAFRACETEMVVEAAGGPQALAKNILVGDRKLLPQLKECTGRVQFLEKKITLVRSKRNDREKKTTGQLLVDCLKWDILDAGEMSELHRAVIRKFKRADSLDAQPLPKEITV